MYSPARLYGIAFGGMGVDDQNPGVLPGEIQIHRRLQQRPQIRLIGSSIFDLDALRFACLKGQGPPF